MYFAAQELDLLNEIEVSYLLLPQIIMNAMEFLHCARIILESFIKGSVCEWKICTFSFLKSLAVSQFITPRKSKVG